MPGDFWRIWQGQLASQLGTQAFNAMALFWLAAHTGSAGAGAGFLALSLLPPVLFGPALVRWSQRWSAKRVLVATDLAACGLALPLVVGIWLDAPSSVLQVALLACAALMALVNALAMPSLHGAVPSLMPADQLPRANGWLLTTQQLAAVAGQALGGAVYAVVGPVALCLANAAGFLSSAWFASRIEAPVLRVPPIVSSTSRSGWRLLRTNPALLQLAGVSALFNALYAPWLVLLPFHLQQLGAMEATTFGIALSAYAAGNVAGAALARRLLSRVGPHLLGLALASQALSLVGLALTATLPALMGMLAMMGAGMGLSNVLALTRVQLLSGPSERASAVAVLRSSVYLATPVGYGVVALAQQVGHITPSTVYATCGVVLLLLLLPTLPALTRNAPRA